MEKHEEMLLGWCTLTPVVVASMDGGNLTTTPRKLSDSLPLISFGVTRLVDDSVRTPVFYIKTPETDSPSHSA